jgi:hypothetical protein
VIVKVGDPCSYYKYSITELGWFRFHAKPSRIVQVLKLHESVTSRRKMSFAS